MGRRQRNWQMGKGGEMSRPTIMQLHRKSVAKERIINDKNEKIWQRDCKIRKLEIDIIRIKLELEKANLPWWKKLWSEK